MRSLIQAYLGDAICSIADHHDKATKASHMKNFFSFLESLVESSDTSLLIQQNTHD